jgi:hypothetical protein
VTYGTIDTPLNHAGHVFVLREDHLEVNQLPHIQNCVEEILGTNHSSVRSRLTPSSMDLFAVDKTATPINIERYRKRVGMLLYLQTCFDITKEINCLAAHVAAPTSDHEAKMFKVAQYLKGRITSGITLKFPLGCTIRLTAWADASFRVHPGARSQYGAMVAINPNAARSLLGLVRQTPRGGRISIRGRICRSVQDMPPHGVLPPIPARPRPNPALTRTRTGTLQGRQPSCDQTYGGAGHTQLNAADTLMSSITLCATWQMLVISSPCTSRPI